MQVPAVETRQHAAHHSRPEATVSFGVNSGSTFSGATSATAWLPDRPKDMNATPDAEAGI